MVHTTPLMWKTYLHYSHQCNLESVGPTSIGSNGDSVDLSSQLLHDQSMGVRSPSPFSGGFFSLKALDFGFWPPNS